MHRSRSRLTIFQAGLIGVIVIVAITYGVFTKFANPFASQFTIHARFASANGLVVGAPVRIAGVDVGKVTGTSAIPGRQASEVSMTIQSNGLPIHRDATFWIRPRIFLEGNFFVDVNPGTPSAPTVSSGHDFPIAAGREPVQFDQLLSSLQLNTRQNLQTLIDQYGKAVDIGGSAYNASIQYWLPAYKYSGEVAHDFLGTKPGDLQTWIAQGGTTNAALDAHPQQLKNLITFFNTTAFAFARQANNLQAAVAELPKTLSVAIPTFDELNAMFPHLDEFAKAFIPGVKSSGPTIDASLPFISQLRQLVQPAELRGLVADLKPTIPALAKLAKATIPLAAKEVRPVSSCVVNVIYPWSQLSINDGIFSGTPGEPVRKVFQEGVDYLPGLAGESRDLDANGPYIRVLGQGGTLTYTLQPGLFGQSLAPIDSVQPAPVPGGGRPPLHPDTPCETQAPITNLNAPPGPPIQQISSNTNAPGASLRWTSAVESAVSAIQLIGKQEGVKVNVTSALLKDLKLP